MNGRSGTPCGITSIFPPGTAYTSRRSWAAKFAHYNQAIGELRDLFEDDALICIRFAKNCVQRRHQRHLQFAKQGQNVAACGASKDAIFMLQANKVIAIEVEKLCGSLVGSQDLPALVPGEPAQGIHSSTPDR